MPVSGSVEARVFCVLMSSCWRSWAAHEFADAMVQIRVKAPTKVSPAPTLLRTGTSAALGWWLTGRGSGEGLTSDSDELPEVETW